MSRQRSSRSYAKVPLSSPTSPVAYPPGEADVLLVPDTPIGYQAADLLAEIVNPQLHEFETSSSTLAGDSGASARKTSPCDDSTPDDNEDANFVYDEEEQLEQEEMARRPFYRRASPYWVLVTMVLASIASTTTITPRVEIYTKLACQALRPEYTFASAGEISASGSVTPPSKLCGQDPDVQAAVAKLVTAMTVSTGILSCLTTGWWGQFSDRYGRTRMLSIAAFGILITDFNFILVTLAAHRLPGGYRFLVVGPIIDGLLGGMSTIMAGLHAYISDCTPPEARSRIFSLNLGLLFGGMALGPTLGGLIVRSTNDLLSVFYLATGSHLFHTFLTIFIIPESLSRASMRKARKRREIIRNEEDAASEYQALSQSHFVVIKAKLRGFLQKLFGFITPLSIFLPYKRTDGKGWSWNLTLLVLSSAFSGLLMGSYQFKFQYSQKAFGWDSEAMGYWLSVVGVVRATYLILILPLALKFFKPKSAPIQLPVELSEALSPTRSGSANDISPVRSISRTRALKHSPAFDLTLARMSLVVELLSYVAMTLAMSSVSWTVATMFGAFGGGFSPALQSVALALYERGPNQGTETGKLFGGLSVVQALSTQILGPSLFGFMYVSTVNTFPKGIFVLAAAGLTCALICISLVRLSTPSSKVGHDQEETGVENEQS